mgnify:CR=1 FL=1
MIVVPIVKALQSGVQCDILSPFESEFKPILSFLLGIRLLRTKCEKGVHLQVSKETAGLTKVSSICEAHSLECRTCILIIALFFLCGNSCILCLKCYEFPEWLVRMSIDGNWPLFLPVEPVVWNCLSKLYFSRGFWARLHSLPWLECTFRLPVFSCEESWQNQGLFLLQEFIVIF